MSATYWEANEDPVPKCIAFVRNVVSVNRGIVIIIPTGKRVSNRFFV